MTVIWQLNKLNTGSIAVAKKGDYTACDIWYTWRSRLWLFITVQQSIVMLPFLYIAVHITTSCWHTLPLAFLLTKPYYRRGNFSGTLFHCVL